MTVEVREGMLLNFDIESNGLLHEVDKVYCICGQDYETKQMFLFHDYPEYDGKKVYDEHDEEYYWIMPRTGTLEEGYDFLERVGNNKGKLICHNVFGYDLFLINKFKPKWKVPMSCLHDTLLQSQCQWFDRPVPKGCKGSHGLKAFGSRLGINKPEIEDWSFMDAYKLHRVIEDVKIQTRTYNYLEHERSELEKKIKGSDFSKILKKEHRYRFYSTMQELNGCDVDIQHMEECLKELDGILVELEEELEPQLFMTLKVRANRIGLYDLQKLLGFKNPRRGKRIYKETPEGIVVEEEKNYYKPTTDIYKIVKTNSYTPVHKKTGEVHEVSFEKIAQARDYVKKLGFKTSDFKYPKEVKESKQLNFHTCNHFDLRPEDTDKVVGAFTRIQYSKSKMSQHSIVKMFLISLGWKPFEWNFKKDAKTNKLVRSDKAFKYYWPVKGNGKNQVVYHVRKGGNLPTTPKLTEESFDTLPEGIGKKVAEYNTYSHRRKYIQNPDPKNSDKGLMPNIRSDGRIAGGIITFGTSTGRGAQRGIVNLPSPNALYGGNMRKIIVAPKGYDLVGCDMAGAQLRLAADFTNNEEYAKALVSGEETEEREDGTEIYLGTDAHTINCIGFGLATEEDRDLAVNTQLKKHIQFMSDARKRGKNGTYATIFGCSGNKLGLMLGVPEHQGQERKEAFLAKLKLDILIEELTEIYLRNKYRGGGYIPTLGGYYVYCKSLHKVLNYKIQGAEAIIQRYAVIKACDTIKRQKMKSELILNIHDEYLFRSPCEESREMAALSESAYKWAAKELGLWIEFGGTAKIGKTYYDVH